MGLEPAGWISGFDRCLDWNRAVCDSGVEEFQEVVVVEVVKLINVAAATNFLTFRSARERSA